MPKWPNFLGASVIGSNLLEFMDWVDASGYAINTKQDPAGMPILTLPPVQRSSVWRPKQVYNLWDSLFRGLPIGTFYLVNRSDSCESVTLDGKTQRIEYPGFDLLDGQQRIRALLVGTKGYLDEKRCLWIDLGAPDAGIHPCLRITSKAQPFGYDEVSGDKLGLRERGKAREILERGGKLECDDGNNGLREAFDYELFDSDVRQQGKPIVQPPLPFKATTQTFKLSDLLAVWRNGDHRNVEDGVELLRAVAGVEASREALAVLHEGFFRIERASVALLKVDTSEFRSHEDDFLALFERIGAAGTPLSDDERLYSIYKHHKPYIRDVVNKIHSDVGHILNPTKIVVTAIRIANAQAHLGGNGNPDVTAFSRAMTEDSGSVFREKLEALIPNDLENSSGGILSILSFLKNSMSFKDDVSAHWIPDVMLASLPYRLWQVLAFWVARCPSAEINSAFSDFVREDVVRFALFWNLCVLNGDKAARISFNEIRKIDAESSGFPGEKLYNILTGSEGDGCACRLVSSKDFSKSLSLPEEAIWRDNSGRFRGEKGLAETLARWWWNGGKILAWIQRDYLRREFPGYQPLSDHEEDLPYDIDHICPKEDWNDWNSVKKRFDGSNKKNMQDNRWSLGDGVGNFRLVASSTNRHDGSDDISKKMNFLIKEKGHNSESDLGFSDYAFSEDVEQIKLWTRVSRSGQVAGRRWNDDRLAAFQSAVEIRAAWLYSKFYNDLEFDEWLKPDA